MKNNRYVLSRMCLALAIMGLPVSIESAEIKKKAEAQETPASQKPKWTQEELERALPYWVGDGVISSVRYALQNGIDIDLQKYNGETMLMDAVSHNQVAMVKYLLERGANVNIQSSHGMTALMYSAHGHDANVAIAQLLLEYGANVLMKNDQGETAYDIAREYENENIAKLLEPLILKPVKLKLRRKATRKAKEAREKADAAERALAQGIYGDLNLDEFDYSLEELQTYFPIWAHDGEEEIVAMAFNSGVDINAVDSDGSGNTALMAAASGNQPKIVEFLLANEAAIDAQNKRGNTALMNAAENGYEEVAKILLEEKADIELKNDEGETAYDLAKQYGHEDIALLLKKRAREMVHQRGL